MEFDMKENFVAAATQPSEAKTVVQGRWGYYPCDHATFLKLKELNKFATKAIRQAAARLRWMRKKPDADGVRRYWKAVRNAQGQRIGYEAEKVARPIPPATNNLLLLADRIARNYRLSRFPKATAEEVQPLDLGVNEISAMLASQPV